MAPPQIAPGPSCPGPSCVAFSPWASQRRREAFTRGCLEVWGINIPWDTHWLMEYRSWWVKAPRWVPGEDNCVVYFMWLFRRSHNYTLAVAASMFLGATPGTQLPVHYLMPQAWISGGTTGWDTDTETGPRDQTLGMGVWNWSLMDEVVTRTTGMDWYRWSGEAMVYVAGMTWGQQTVRTTELAGFC